MAPCPRVSSHVKPWQTAKMVYVIFFRIKARKLFMFIMFQWKTASQHHVYVNIQQNSSTKIFGGTLRGCHIKVGFSVIQSFTFLYTWLSHIAQYKAVSSTELSENALANIGVRLLLQLHPMPEVARVSGIGSESKEAVFH